MKNRIFFYAICLLSPSCGNDSKTSAALNVSIPFSVVAADQAINCTTTLKSVGTPGVDVKLQDFRFYIHDVTLLDTNGTQYPMTLTPNQWQTNDLALLDFQDKSDNCEGDSKPTYTALLGTVSDSLLFTAISFKLGVPSKYNHADQARAQSPLNVPSLFWSWQTGYKFMRADFAPLGGIKRPSNIDYNGTTFNFHLGSTDCQGSPEQGEVVSCKRANIPTIQLQNFTVNLSRIQLDYSKLVKDLPLNQDIAETAGCMSGQNDPECSNFFKALGMDLASGTPASGLLQTVFSVR